MIIFIFLFALLLIASWGYQLLALASLWRFFSRRTRPAAPTGPGLTVFKPVKGLEANTRECLESFLSQAYQPYQVIFGVRDPADPVVALLQELKQTHAETDIDLVFCPEPLGLNPKISKLRQMEAQARYDLLVISDADVKVGPEFLSRVAAALQEPGIGLVSCPYRFGPALALGAKLEALTIAADFIPSVATAHYVEGIRFALGAAMALSRQALNAIGGFAPLADFLADDYQLGWRVAEAGLGVKVLPYVVETQNPELSLKDYLVHQLRWTRTYRVCRPQGYLAYGITHTLVFSLLLCWAAAGAPWALAWAMGTLGLREILATVARFYLGVEPVSKNFLLLPLKDLLAFGLWTLSFLGDRVTWGGKTYRVTPEGKLVV